MSNRYLVIRLAWGPLLFTTRSFGKVEMRSARKDTPAERACLERSAQAFGMRVHAIPDHVTEEPSVEFCSRLVVIVEADSITEASRIAAFQFEETLDILETLGSISRYVLERAGMVCDIKSATKYPILPRDTHKVRKNSIIDVHDMNNLQPMKVEQLILSYDANGRNCYELADRLLRSAYWSRKARSEINPQLRVLFRWFSIESIWLSKSEDGSANQEDAISPTMWALGFPTNSGIELRAVKEKTDQISKEICDYRTWRDRIRSDLNRIRLFRNRTVHNGFRMLDVGRGDINHDDLRYFDNLSYRACGHVQNFAVIGLSERLTTAKELVGLLPLIFENYVSAESINHLLHSLTNMPDFVRYVQPDWDRN